MIKIDVKYYEAFDEIRQEVKCDTHFQNKYK